jgi:hypothetical protein
MTEAEIRDYEALLKEGKRRFGSPCRHENTRNGRCLKCLRPVITRGMIKWRKSGRDTA